jgi:hypothetical protein
MAPSHGFSALIGNDYRESFHVFDVFLILFWDGCSAKRHFHDSTDYGSTASMSHRNCTECALRYICVGM